MRREQIHKLCCNHYLSPDLILKPMSTSETAWCWNAMDYTNPEGTYEHFAVRFKVCINGKPKQPDIYTDIRICSDDTVESRNISVQSLPSSHVMSEAQFDEHNYE